MSRAAVFLACIIFSAVCSTESSSSDAGGIVPSLATPDAGTHGIREFVKHSPAFSLLTIKLDANSSIRAEAGALVAMQDVQITTELASSPGASGCLPLLGIIKRSFGGLSICNNVFKGKASGKGWVSLAPWFPGDIVLHHLNPDSVIFIQPGSFLGCWPSVHTTSVTKGWKTVLSGEGPFFVKAWTDAAGGKVYIASYGAVEKLLVRKGETLTVDTGHVVAYEDGITFSIGIAGQFMFGGEGLVCNFSVKDRGPRTKEGFVYIQTRHTPPSRNGD